ncbi:MAG: hypothetical protein WC319_09345 [Candidatus Paceibacterota bacterium]|jgi:hypothetical protein
MRPVNNKHEINTLRLPLGAGGGLFTLQLIAVWALCIFCVNTHAAILGVALDGSQPYGVIQEAIDASAHGDTVLVYPGRYIENVRFNGKNITLASLELLSGDRDYIHSTVMMEIKMDPLSYPGIMSPISVFGDLPLQMAVGH